MPGIILAHAQKVSEVAGVIKKLKTIVVKQPALMVDVVERNDVDVSQGLLELDVKKGELFIHTFTFTEKFDKRQWLIK